MAETAQDRRLPATPRRLEKAREEGQVARSRDLGHFAVLAAGVGLLAVLAVPAVDASLKLLQQGLKFDVRSTVEPSAMVEHLGLQGGHMMALLVPLLAAVWGLAVACGVASGGWNFTWQPLAPRWSKLNPLAGLGRVFSGHQLFETLKACLLSLVLGAVAVLVLRQQWQDHGVLLAMPLPAALAHGGQAVLGGLVWVVVVLGVFALFDVPLQRQMLARRLRMSLEEVKQELKEQEGNPQIKSRVRQRMREMASRRMLAAVPGADLVVMNPTHYAVALKYDEATMAAPRVVAKGADLVALRIRDIAREAQVPVLQSPALARALYAHTELDQEVPARLFTAVAQVLAWVFQLRDALATGRAVSMAPPTPDVPADLDPAVAGPATRGGRRAAGAAARPAAEGGA